MKLSVIIVNYNVKYYLHQCLCSVERALRGIDGEIVVVDNHSSDGSVPFLRRLHPGVKFLKNAENLGFAKANNRALRKCRSDYALLLNPDTIVGEQSLRACVDWMDSHPDAGAVGVKMLNADGSFAKESRRGVPTPWVAFCKMAGLSQLWPKSRRFGHYYMDYLNRESPAEIEIVSGAFMMLNRQALAKAGLLDEDFFMYGEDVDLSYRVLLAGYRNYYVPTPILHYKGESTHRASVGYVNAFHKAMLIFFRKHFGGYNRWVALPVRWAIQLKADFAHLKAWVRRRSDEHSSPLYYLGRMTYALQDPADREEAEAILSAYGIQLTDDTAAADLRIVNAERTPFADILDQLEQQDEARGRSKVATLFPSIHALVTASYVFHLDKD